MLTDYIRAAMRRTKYEILEDDKTFYGHIPGFQGVYANAPTLERVLYRVNKPVCRSVSNSTTQAVA